MPFGIRFLPENRTFVAEEPVDLFLAASRCDIWVEQPCGAKTSCGKCRVRVAGGPVLVTAADARLLSVADITAGWRLGCQFTVAGDCVVEVPPQSRAVPPKAFGEEHLDLDDLKPLVVRRVVAVPRGDDHCPEAILDGLARALAEPGGGGPAIRRLHASWEMAAALPALVRNHDALALVVSGRELLAAEPPGTGAGAAVLGVAVDLGSTSLAAALVDLRDGRVLGVASRLNPQVRYGPDVISRIHYAQEHEEGNARLHQAIAGGVGEMIQELAARTGAATDRIFAITCAGNATMTHTAVGADVTPLGEAPYEGVLTGEWEMGAREAGWPTHRDARVRFLPLIARHIGGDTVGAALACQLDRADRWRLLIDLGTNAEVVIGCRQRIVTTSTAAGPAFEGANISCGMRAAPGAIDAVRVLSDGRVVVGTVANRPPRGLCGSGLVDAAAELLRAGVIAPSGYLRSRAECQAIGVAPRLASRVVQMGSGERGVRLAGDVTLSAQDVRQLQLAKGSTAAGIALLLDDLGLTIRDLEAVLIAGTFGSYLRKASALAIGLVPPIDPELVRFVGNAAGAGARLVLVDQRARRRAIRLARRAEDIELAGHPGYQEAFCSAIPFPDPGARSGRAGP